MNPVKKVPVSTLLIALLFSFGWVSCRSSEPLKKSSGSETDLATLFDASEIFSANFTGFALYDSARDSMLYAQNEKRYFTPASNTKLFTFYTGLKLLPDSLRALEYVVRGDSLIFWGTGDPSFLHPELGNGSVYAFLQNSTHDLYFSDANFADERMGPGWAWDDYNYAYSAEITPLPMYGNLVRFTMQKIELQEIGRTDGKLSIYPAVFRSLVDTVFNRGIGRASLLRGMSSNQFLYQPSADTTTYSVWKPYHYTPQLITEMLTDTLHKPVQYIKREKPASTSVLYSIPADTAYKHMLQPSDNFIAEQLLLMTASELGKPLNARLAIDKMKEQYLSAMPDEPQWVDGSGLSRYNLFTPRSMIWLLQQIDREFESDEKLFKLLPAGGKQGTIENWYAARDGGPAYVFAKTGTLSNNHCLSGYLITESGKKLLFSFMNNHYVSSSSRIKKEMEKVLWYIHKNY